MPRNSQYKDYVLVLLFVKYVSDMQDDVYMIVGEGWRDAAKPEACQPLAGG